MKNFKEHEKTYKLLHEIIPDFDATYSSAAVMECQMMKEKINKYMPFVENKDADVRSISGISYFKINFREPVIQFIPNELQHFRQSFLSRSFSADDDQYVYTFVPSYVPNINHLTLKISYAANASEEASVNKNFDSFKKLTWEQKYNPMSIDTLNRFLKESSQQQDGISNENITEKIRMCFEFCFWNLPDLNSNGRVISFDNKKGFGFIDRQQPGKENLYFHKSAADGILSKDDYVQYDLGRNSRGIVAINVKKMEKDANRSVIHNFIYDRPRSIVDIVVIRKTIARIDDLKDKEESIEIVSTKPVKARLANVTFLADDGDDIRTKTQNMYVTRNAAEGLENGDLINCVIAKSISKHKRGHPFSHFMVVGKVGKKIGLDLKHFLALSTWKKLQNIDHDKSLCKIGNVSEVKRSVTEMIRKIDFDMLKFIDNEKTLSSALDAALQELFPLFVTKDDLVYHNPPALISHIANFYPDILCDKELMTDIATLFEYFLNNYQEWGSHAQMKLRTSEQYENIQMQSNVKIDLNHFLNSVPVIANRIVYSRLYSQHWKQWLPHN